ncbi:aminotransferase class V-fold PLP-dependent enzyme [bacterium]|nr:aminotransferase class V-fold PLP-dependent enzyme [bacterium]
MNLQKIRSEFPHLQTDQIYFDHAAVSPLCNRSRNYLERYINTVQSDKINSFEDTLNLSERIRKNISTLLHTNQGRIAIVKNTTDGLILLARGLSWQPGDNIVLYRNEFPSNVYPWYDLKYLGVKVKFIDSKLGKVTPIELESIVTKKTKLVSVSWVQYSSGYRNDLKELADWCHDRNIILAVDAMQGLGALDLNVEETSIDFLSTGTAKWLLGPHGIGFIYLTKQLQDKLNPPHLGWYSRQDMMNFHDYDQPLKTDASRFEFATPFSLGIWAFAGATGILLESGSVEIENRIINLTDYLVNGLNDIGLQVISDRSSSAVKSGIVYVSHPNKNNNEKIYNRLDELRVSISLRNNKLRISPHFYNTHTEIDKFLNIIESITNKL